MGEDVQSCCQWSQRGQDPSSSVKALQDRQVACFSVLLEPFPGLAQGGSPGLSLLLPGISNNSQNCRSSKATLWGKAQHEGALPPPCIVRKDRGFHTQLDEGPETP